ncbi:MAG: META domain-containing protein, partial [Roseovarius sp.]|nr:META domain-containing protein [Roseovarius sp.]
LAEEALYLTALAEMTLVEVLGDVMILSNDAGREMVFRAGE